MPRRIFWVYVLKSLKDGSLYTGSTQNIELRLKQHNQGRGQYTKSLKPWKLFYKESFGSRSEAVLRERVLKSGEGRLFLKSLQ